VLILLGLFFLAGCGLKTNLVVYDDSAPLPEIAQLSSQMTPKALTIQLDIRGGSGLVFYEVDRTEIEPNCKCIGHWLRYYVSSPSAQRQGLQRHMKLRQGTIYAYRVRVGDALGRKSVWSKAIKSKQAVEEPTPVVKKENVEKAHE